jgi:hypothetical protein
MPPEAARRELPVAAVTCRQRLRSRARNFAEIREYETVLAGCCVDTEK